MLDLFFTAAWKVLVAGLVLGAGLPAVFALGVRFSAAGVGATDVQVSTGRAGYRVLGVVCFLVVALAVSLGITVIVASGFGKLVSFEHVWPTLVDKG
jgi:2-methylisocitrate lyase-like PEP mutase family enzyme